MYRKTQLLAGSALAALVLAAPVRADVTPGQVWDDLESYLQDFGYRVSGNETASGDSLVIAGFAVTMDLPESEGTFSFTADEIVLKDTGDGSVSLTFPPQMPIRLTVRPETGEAVDLTVDYTQTGLEMIVSGSPGEMVYDYTADRLGMTLSDLVVDGAPVGRDLARMQVTVSDVEGRSTVSLGDGLRRIAQGMRMGSVAYDLAFKDPESDGSGLFSGRMDQLSFEGATSFPQEMTAQTPAALFAAGLGGNGTFSHQGGASAFSATESGQTTSGETSTGAVEMQVALSQDAVTYDVTARDLTLSLVSSELPFPVAAQMAETGFNMTLPLAAAEAPQEMAIGLTLGGFTMSDMLWGIFDPAAALPRGPATLSVDLAGTVTPFVDLFDPEAMAVLEKTGGVPGELNTLTLRDLTVEAVGARIGGSGSFTFDNADLETFDGMPAPEGSVTLSLEGGNALIDRLIEMGVLAEQDAMGARMMMSMFTVPGTGEDSLRSEIEVKPNGQILANGQRIK